MAISLQDLIGRIVESSLLTEAETREVISEWPADRPALDGEQFARELVKQKRLTKFQAEQLYAGKGKSLTLGNYVILDKLGQGGMGMVLKAQHKRMKRVVALKVMSGAAVKSADAVRRFHREVEAAAKLTHPNIVTAFDADEAKGTHFLVMEYVEGDDLSALVKKHGPMSVEQAIECIIQAARGLAHAHSQGVVHRDIKPANLLLDKNGTVKILDMGLARLESGLSDAGGVEGAGLTQSGTIMGTVDYMSPEQAEDTRHADARADIYSLGCALYYLLTGQAVYGGETMMKKLLAHREVAIPSLVADAASVRSDASSVGHALDAVFHKMVAKRPADRYQSMTEVIADLERCRAGQSVTMNVAAVSGESGSNYELQNFLRQISGEGASSLSSGGTVGTSRTPVDASAETMLLTNGRSGTDPQTEQTIATERLRLGQQRSLIGTGIAAVLVLLIGVWLFRTPRGVMQVEITDAEIEVAIGETNQTLKGEQNKTLKLPIGEHVLHVTLGETQLDTPEITVAKGEPVEIKVERVGNRVRVMRGKEFLVAKELPRAKTGDSKGGNAEAVPQFALEFDGQSSHVDLPNLGLTLSKPMTVEAWVMLGNSDGANGGDVIVGASNFNLTVLNKRRLLSFHGSQTKDGPPVKFSSDKELAVGEWVHVAAVSDGELRTLFLNGHRQKATNQNKPSREDVLDVVLGAMPQADKMRPEKCLNGRLRQARFSKTARYSADFQPAQRFAPDKDTLALYQFDEGQGSVLKDSSGNGHHGKIVGAKWVKRDDSPVFAPTGSSQFALQFDRREKGITIQKFPKVLPGPFTLEAFVTPTKFPAEDESISDGFLGIRNTMTIRLRNPGNWFVSVSGRSLKPVSVELNKQVHVAVVCDGPQAWLFVDGKLKATDSFADSPMSSEPIFYLGHGFTGLIREVRVSNAARYKQDFTPTPQFEPDAATLALYHMDEGSGDVLKDSSGNGHHGKIVGAKWVMVSSGVGGSAGAQPIRSGLRLEPGAGADVSLKDKVGELPIATLEVLLTLPDKNPAANPSFAGKLLGVGGSDHGAFDAKITVDPTPTGRVWRMHARTDYGGVDHKYLSVESAVSESPGRIVHVAGVRTPNEVRLFVDGKLIGTNEGRIPPIRPGSILLGWKGDVQNNAAGSVIHEVRVSKVARYDKDFAPATRMQSDDATVALYQFDEDPGDTLKDLSGNGHHGKIIGAKWLRSGRPSAAQTLNDPAFQKWLKDVAALPPEEQVKSVIEKLKELNPGFDGREAHRIDNSSGVSTMKFDNEQMTNIAPIRALRGLTDLNSASFSGAHSAVKLKPRGILSDLSPLQGLPLTILQITNTAVSDLSPLKGMPLTKLTLTGTLVTDLSPLRGMSLTELHIQATPVSDLKPIAGMPLTKLSCYNSDVSDLAPLKGMPLTYFHASSTPVSDLSPLRRLPLEWLDCIGTQVSDVTPLHDCKKLTVVRLGSTRVTADGVAALQKALPNCKIEWDGKPAAPPPAKAPFDAKQSRAHQEAWAKHLGMTVETTNSVGAKMILIPPGEFLMGSSDAQIEVAVKEAEQLRWGPAVVESIRKAERPQHRVVITKPFLMGATEVTLGQFKKFVAATGHQTQAEIRPVGPIKQTYLQPGYPVTDESPVANVSRQDATAYCRWLSGVETATYRLPTEAEWEYACRAGTTSLYSFGDDPALLGKYAWSIKDSKAQPHPVGTKLPNPFGLFDMHGNLSEWCQDRYDESWYAQSPVENPTGPATGYQVVLRGGNWDYGSILRSAYRLSHNSSANYHYMLGFRVVRGFDAPEAK